MPWVNELLKITLGAFRIGGLFVSMPLFGTTPFPPQLKFMLALALSFMLLPFQPPIPPAIWESNGALLMVIAREVGLGLFIGFGVRLVFLIMTFTLEFAGLQMGFSIANIFDPQTSSQLSILAGLGVNLMLLYFLVTNLHHDVFFTLVKSYEKIPIGLPDWNMQPMLGRLLDSFRTVFDVSLRLAFPVVFAMLAIHVVLAVVSRTAPQMNLFFNITFIVNVVSGVLLVGLSWPQMFTQIHRFARDLVYSGYHLW